MGKLFYVIGKSSTGKDTVFKNLMENPKLALRPFVMYTTRPMRGGEQPGVEYYFTDEEELARMTEQGNVIEVRSYDTVHGVWKYFTAHGESIDLENNSYAMIGGLDSFRAAREYYGTEKVIPIYIEVEDGERLQRALDREKAQDQPKYEEMCRRFLADAEDFSEERIRQAGIVKRFYNNDLEECLEEITGYLRDNI